MRAGESHGTSAIRQAGQHKGGKASQRRDQQQPRPRRLSSSAPRRQAAQPGTRGAQARALRAPGRLRFGLDQARVAHHGAPGLSRSPRLRACCPLRRRPRVVPAARGGAPWCGDRRRSTVSRREGTRVRHCGASPRARALQQVPSQARSTCLAAPLRKPPAAHSRSALVRQRPPSGASGQRQTRVLATAPPRPCLWPAPARRAGGRWRGEQATSPPHHTAERVCAGAGAAAGIAPRRRAHVCRG